jgi:hypothetical protein
MANDTQTTDWRKLAQQILDKLNELATLEIITGVGDTTKFKLGQESGARAEVFKNLEIEKVILTRVDLVQGDITTVYHQDYIGNADLVFLRDYHDQQRDKGHAIVKENIEAVVSLIELWKNNRTTDITMPPEPPE